MTHVVPFLLVLSLGLPTASAEVVTVTGQVVCSSCWFEADRAKVRYGDDADVECAQRCAGEGIPRALAVRRDDGSHELLILRAASTTGSGESFLDSIGAVVTATGTIDRSGEKPVLHVRTLVVLKTRKAVQSDAH